MQGKMRASRYYGKEDIRVEQIEEPEVGDAQIKIRPSYVGICGTDLHEYLGGPTFAPTTPHPVTKDVIPITFGHEFSGTISEIGPNVPSSQSHLKVGDKCAIQPTVYCGSCGACNGGVENACYNGGFVGLSGGGGGLSDAVCVPAEAVFKLPDNVPLDIGALVEPLSVAMHALSAAPKLDASTCVLVLGGGPIGLAVVQCLKGKGVGKVIVSEVASSRQAFAKEFGAHHVLDPKTYDLVQISRELSGGDGPDVVFDCAGVSASLKTACQSVKFRGTVVNVAIWEKEVPFNPNWLVFREANYKAVLGYQARDFREVIDMLGQGKIEPRKMITSKIKMENLVNDGFKPLIHNKDKHVKILVEVTPGSS